MCNKVLKHVLDAIDSDDLLLTLLYTRKQKDINRKFSIVVNGSTRYHTILTYAIFKQRFDIALHLIDLGVSPDICNPMLHLIYVSHNFAIAKPILESLWEKGANIHSTEDIAHIRPSNAFFYAISRQYSDFTAWFMKKGFNLHTQDEMGNTALHIACHYNNYYMAQRIMDSDRMDILIKNKNNETAATFLDGKIADNQIIRTFLNKGFDPNEKTTRNFTMLHKAAIENNVELAEMLLEHGANTSLKTLNGNTATQIANFYSSRGVYSLLMNRRAKLVV